MKVLITGGTGYIGSHTAIEIANAGHEVVVVDDFSNSSPKVVEIIKSLTDNPISFEEANIKDQKKINGIFEEHNPEAVIHFSALLSDVEMGIFLSVTQTPLRQNKN